MILSVRVSFPSKIYITLGINSLEKLSNFLRKVLILSILAKMTIGFRSILVVNSVKNDNFFRSVNFFRYVCFTGKSENLAETPILKNFFHFCSQ